jgi:hypothetical protein
MKKGGKKQGAFWELTWGESLSTTGEDIPGGSEDFKRGDYEGAAKRYWELIEARYREVELYLSSWVRVEPDRRPW